MAPPSGPTACSHTARLPGLKPRKGARAFRAGAPLTRPALATSARTGGGGGDAEPAQARARILGRTPAPRGPEDSPSTTAASDTERPVPRTPARWWPTWRRGERERERNHHSGEARAPLYPGRALALWRMRAPRPAPPPTSSRAGLGESTWSVGRQRAASAPRGSDVSGAGRGGREGAWSGECPGGRGGAGRHPGATWDRVWPRR